MSMAIRATSGEVRGARRKYSERFLRALEPRTSNLEPGFTLIETMVAISLLTVAIVAPMLLTVQSLKSAYYARDQITASYLAQEAIEVVHATRDANILKIAQGQSVGIFDGIPSISGLPFTVDAPGDTMTLCSGACAPLKTDPTDTLYGHNAAWTKNTVFTRTVTACYLQPSPSTDCNGTLSDEIRVSVTVSWQTGTYQQRTISISANLYPWVISGSGT